MATLAVGILIGGAEATLFTIALQVGAAYVDAAYVEPALRGDKGNDIQGPRINDLPVQTVTEGSKMNWFVGPRFRAAGQIIWRGALVEVKKKKKSGKGGGGGSSTTYRYYMSVTISWGESPISRVLTVWANSHIIYNLLSNQTSDGRYAAIRHVDGSNLNQAPDSEMESQEGVGNVPAYKECAYTVLEDLYLADFGNSMPQFTALIEADSPVTEFRPFYVLHGRSFDDQSVHLERYLGSTSDEFPNRDWDYELSSDFNGLNNMSWLLEGQGDGGNIHFMPRPAGTARNQVVDADDGTLVGDATGYWSGSFSRSGILDDMDNAFFTDGDIIWMFSADGQTMYWNHNPTHPALLNRATAIECWKSRERYFVWGDDSAVSSDRSLIYGDGDKLGSGALTAFQYGGNKDPDMLGANVTNMKFIDSGETLLLLMGGWYTTTSGTPTRATLTLVDITDGTVLWRANPPGDMATTAPALGIFAVKQAEAGLTAGARIFVGYTVSGSGRIYEVNATTGATLQTSALALWTAATVPNRLEFDSNDNIYMPGRVFGQSGQTIDILDGNDLAGGLIQEIPVDAFRFNGDPISGFMIDTVSPAFLEPQLRYSQAIEKILKRSGLTSADYDLSGIDLLPTTALFRGMVVHGPQRVQAQLEPPMLTGNLGSRELNGKMEFFVRDQTVPTVIDPDDMGVAEGDAAMDGSPASIADIENYEINNEINFKFMEPDSGYQQASQRYRRPGTISKGAETVQVPMVLTTTEGQDIARRLLWSAWTERQSVNFSLPPKYLSLEDGDLLGVSIRGEDYEVRIIRLTVGQNFMLEIEGIVEDARNFTTDNASDSQVIDQPDVYSPPDVRPVIMDIPALRAQELLTPYYYASQYAVDADAEWVGAQLNISLDDVAFTAVFDQIVESDGGDTTTTLADGPRQYWDRANTVDILMAEGELESVSEQEVLAGLNRVLIGDEIVGFQNATLIDVRTYRISKLLRGLRDTPTSGHTSSDQVTVLNEADIVAVEYSTSIINATRFWRGVAQGDDPADASSVTQQLTAKCLDCFAPVHLAATRDGSSNIDIVWNRVDRSFAAKLFGTATTTPMIESTEEYELDIYDDGDVFLRTVTGVTTETYQYTAGDQTTDGQTPGDPIRVEVFQVSALLGRGNASIRTEV